MPQYGLSEVRFFQVPVRARQPMPADPVRRAWSRCRSDLAGRTRGRLAQGLLRHGRAGGDRRDRAGPDRQPTTASIRALWPSGTTYFWKVVEVNEAATPSAWEGDVWSFTTQEYLVVDDMESYTDDEGSRIYETWIDGYDRQQQRLDHRLHGGPVRRADDRPRRQAVDALRVQQRQCAVLQRGRAGVLARAELDRQWGRHPESVGPGQSGGLRRTMPGRSR